MRGHIKRLSRDIEELDAKIRVSVEFKDNPGEPINDKWYELFCKQEDLMRQLLDVLRLRLANEKEIYPDHSEDLPDDCDEQVEW